MKTLLCEKKILYDGSQLKSHFIYRNFGLRGDAMISFTGGCDVKDHLVDLEDSLADDFIYSPEMLHFIIEHFGMPLKEAVARQRLLMSIIMEELSFPVKRKGDDLFFKDRKLSVSIATVTPVSALIHTGLNIKTEGCPVKVCGLLQFDENPQKIAGRVLKRYQKEDLEIIDACCKVLPR